MLARMKYVIAKPRKNGSVAYYWQRKGHPIRRLPDDETERFAMARRLNDDAERGDTAVAVSPKAGTIAWALDEIRETTWWSDLAPNTRKLYEHWVIALAGEVGSRSLADLDEAAVDEILASIKSHQRKKHCNAVLTKISKLAVRRRYITHNPCVNLGLKSSGKRHQLWTIEEENEFLVACANDPHGESVGLAFLLMRYTGQRVNDVLELTWAAYDGQQINLTQQKRKRDVSVPVFSELKEVLDEARAKTTSTMIVTNERGQRLPYSTWKNRFANIRTQAGIEGLQARDLRRTCVVWMGEAGCTPQEIASWTGWSIARVMHILDVYSPRTRRLAERGLVKMEDARKQRQGERKQHKF